MELAEPCCAGGGEAATPAGDLCRSPFLVKREAAWVGAVAATVVQLEAKGTGVFAFPGKCQGRGSAGGRQLVESAGPLTSDFTGGRVAATILPQPALVSHSCQIKTGYVGEDTEQETITISVPCE